MADRITSFRDLRVYQHAFDAAMEVFELSKRFPASESRSLTDQIRRSTRSVCANTAEAWRKRRYRAAFVSKISDAESEAAESQVWLDFALRCQYLDKATWERLNDAYDHIQAQFMRMIARADQWLIGSTTSDNGPSTKKNTGT
jgi:four helix bundle protein